MNTETMKDRTITLTKKELMSLSWIWFFGTTQSDRDNIYQDWRNNPELSELYNKLFK